MPETAAYTTSKAGVRAFSDALRADLAETAIRVTEVLPGLTRTNINLKRHRGDRALEKAYFDQARFTLDPEDVARMVLFALEQPAHMQIAQLFVLPVQAGGQPRSCEPRMSRLALRSREALAIYAPLRLVAEQFVSSAPTPASAAQSSIARFAVSLGVDRLDADLIGAGLQMRREATRDRRRIAPEDHRIDRIYRNRHRRDRLR